jgi:hypothetical protein
MKFDRQLATELHALVETLREDDLTDVQAHRLEHLVDSSRLARRLYLELIGLHVGLHWRFNVVSLEQPNPAGPSVAIGSQIADLPAPNVRDQFDELLQSAMQPASNALLRDASAKSSVSQNRTKPAPAKVLELLGGIAQRSIVLRGVLPLAVAATLLIATWYWWRHSSMPSPTTTVAYLVAEKDCQWEQTTPLIGDALAAGRLHLRSGVAKLQFADGARLAVEGPSDFEIISANSMYLAQGKLLAQVPSHAIGFTVETRYAKVVDRGTEFVLEASEGQPSKLAVTKGTVDLVPASGSPRRIKAGTAISLVRRDADRTTIEAAPFAAAWIDHAAHLAEVLPPKADDIVSYQLTQDRVAGNQETFRGGLALDFDVQRPIRIGSLGVFDHLGDGIDSDSKLTVQLWSRDNRNTPNNPLDDVAGRVLVELIFSASDSGRLMFGHRFKPLTQPIELKPGSYSIVAYGWSDNNRCVNLTLPKAPASRLETDGGAIAAVSSRFQDHILQGTFPSLPARRPISFAAGSFRFTLEDAQSSK